MCHPIRFEQYFSPDMIWLLSKIRLEILRIVSFNNRVAHILLPERNISFLFINKKSFDIHKTFYSGISDIFLFVQKSIIFLVCVIG